MKKPAWFPTVIGNQIVCLQNLKTKLPGYAATLPLVAAAIVATSSNSNGVGNLSLNINNNPPQQYEVQPIADKVDELINALRR